MSKTVGFATLVLMTHACFFHHFRLTWLLLVLGVVVFLYFGCSSVIQSFIEKQLITTVKVKVADKLGVSLSLSLMLEHLFPIVVFAFAA